MACALHFVTRNRLRSGITKPKADIRARAHIMIVFDNYEKLEKEIRQAGIDQLDARKRSEISPGASPGS